MTNENRRENIANELERASDALREARLLFDAGLANGAVSRAYYAVFHAMRAALLSRGVDPKTHAGVLQLFNLHLTRPGLLPAFTKAVAALQRSREIADYDAAVVFTVDEARALLTDAETLAGAVTALLRAEAWR